MVACLHWETQKAYEFGDVENRSGLLPEAFAGTTKLIWHNPAATRPEY